MSVSAQLRRVKRLERKLSHQRSPRQWYLTLEEGEEIPATIAAKIRPEDRVAVRYWPAELMLREGNWSYGHVTTPGGTFIVWPDGRLEKVIRK